MTCQEARDILRDAVAPRGPADLMTRLSESPGRLSPMDTSTAGELPEGDSYGDRVLQALLVVRRHVAGQKMVERELLGILVLLDLPIRKLAAEPGHDRTRIPQISLALDAICVVCLIPHD